MQNMKKDGSEVLSQLMQNLASDGKLSLYSGVKNEDCECETCIFLWRQICLAQSRNDIKAEKRLIQLLEHH